MLIRNIAVKDDNSAYYNFFSNQQLTFNQFIIIHNLHSYMSHLQLNQLSQQNAIFSNMKTLTITTLNQSISAYLNTGNTNQLQSAEKVIAQLQSSNTELPMDISSSKLSQQLTSFNVLLKGELRSSGKLANNLIGYYYSMFKLAYRA